MATEIVLRHWPRMSISWAGIHYEEQVVEIDGLCNETRMWLSPEQRKFLDTASVKSKIELDTPQYPEGFSGTSIYTKITLIFEHDHEAFEFAMKHL